MSSQDPPSTRLSASTRQGPLRFGPYTVTGELGRGAMGVVFRAVDLQTGHEVALKLALNRLDGARLKRFEREGSVTAKLVHEGIVRVVSAGTADGRPYVAYELIEGARPLDEAAREAPLGRRVELVRDAARALGYAHSNGVVHRDVKPANVLVDAKGHVRVADFGLATGQEDERLTLTGSLMGTPEFMSPEQLQGRREAVGPWSDVWAVGVMLSQALCGQHPFPSQSLLELMEKVEKDVPLTPRRVDGKTPPALEAVVLRALERDPKERYPDGEALAEDLDRFLEGSATSAEIPLDARPGTSRSVVALATAAALAVALAVIALVATRPGASQASSVTEVDASTGPAITTPATTTTMAAVVESKTDSRAQPAAALTLVERGREAMHQGRFEEGLELLTEAIALDPKAPRAHMSRAGALINLKRMDEAAEEATLATQLDPERFEAWLNLSLARHAQKRFDEALAAATRAVELAPHDVDARMARIHALMAKDDPGGALPDCDALLAIDPDHALGLGQRAKARWSLGDQEGARADVGRAVDLAPANGELLALRGTLTAMSGDLAAGLVDFDKALEAGFDDAHLRMNRSLALHSLGRLQEALEEADKGVSLGPEDVDQWVNRANLRLIAGRFEGSIADATHALSMTPNSWNALMNRGMALVGSRQHALAIEDFTAALTLQPDHPVALIERGRAHAGNDDHEAALRDLERGLELNPKSEIGWTQLGLLRAGRGEHALALVAYTRAIELAPDVGPAYHRRALVQLALGDTDAARADWERALGLLDRNDRLRITVGEHLRELRGER